MSSLVSGLLGYNVITKILYDMVNVYVKCILFSNASSVYTLIPFIYVIHIYFLRIVIMVDR